MTTTYSLLSSRLQSILKSKLTVSFSQYQASGSFFVSVLILISQPFKTHSIFKVIVSGSGQNASKAMLLSRGGLKKKLALLLLDPHLF